MATEKNGNNGANTLLDSASPLIVLADGRPSSLPQMRENGKRIQHYDPLNALQPSSGEPEPLNFRAFPDGTLVELVRSQSSPGRLGFLIWSADAVQFQQSFGYDGSLFVPPRVSVSLLGATCLPTGIAPCGSAEEILNEIALCISRYIELAPEHLRIVSYFVLYTWFQDLLSIAPYLWIIGPHSAGKTRLLRLLHALCRRAVMGSDISPAALYSLPSAIMPTLLIDEFETSGRAGDRDLLRLLRSGSTHNGHVIRGWDVYDTFCAKVVASRQEPVDTALASRAVFIPMLPTRRMLPCLDTATLQQIADQFQPRLLYYRLQHYSQVITGDRPKVAQFTPRMGDLALALAAPVLGNPQLETQLFQDLAAQDEEAKLARQGEPEWVVTTALFYDCHQTGGTLTVGSLASTVSGVLLRSGETYELQPRRVGAVLHSLGLRTEKLGNQGRGLRLTKQVIRQVHKLALGLGIKRADILPYATVDAGYAGYPCSFCQEFGLLARDDGKKLRTLPRAKRRRGSLYD